MKRMNEHTTKLLAAAGLILTTMIWGSAFVVMKNSVDVIPPTYLLALRFTIAAAALVLFFHGRLKRIGRRTLFCGAVLGFFLGLSYLFQTYGIKYTTASKNAFITTLYVVIVPFLHWFLNRVKPKPNHLAAAGIAVIGLALLSLQGDLTVNLGDFLTFICGICFAMHMVLIDRYTTTEDPVVLTVLQIAAAALMNWILAPFLDGAFQASVLFDPPLLGGVIYLALFSTMLGFLLQNVGQKYLTANTSSILLSTESVFGTIFSVIFLKEVVTGRMLLGCLMMLAAVLLSEYRPKRKTEREIDGEVVIHS